MKILLLLVCRRNFLKQLKWLKEKKNRHIWIHKKNLYGKRQQKQIQKTNDKIFATQMISRY